MFLSNKLNMGAGTPAPTIDPQFNNVTMLLHGDGTNGAQNNTFLDSSSNNFTITRNGNTTQGSFSPYGSNWSTFFDGTQDNLYTASTSALNVGSGNFTFECFFNVSVFNGGNILRGANQYSACALLLSGTGVIYYISSTGSNWDIASGQTAISSGLSVGVWYHLALVRNGNVVTPYVNGVAGTTTTTSASFSANNGFNIGAEQNGVAGGSFNGFISNVRVVVGTAVYTSNFTPPTANLTAISGTQLLACQNSQFKDNSSNNFSFTTAGTPSIQRFNPFGTSTAYSTSVIGGSGYFDGTGDYLTIPSTSAFNFGSNNFTVEFWLRTNVDTGNIINPNTNGNWGLFLINGNFNWNNAYNVTNLFSVNATSIVNNAWHHIAYVRLSGTIYVYFDGVLQTSNADPTVYTSAGSTWNIGSGNVGNFNGYISDMRINNGTAVYTSAFTPPTAPLTAIANTQLLTNYTNGAIFDNAMMNDLETVGNAQISTSVVKYGTGSLAFDGTGDNLNTPASPNLAFGTGDFTIECWVYANDVTSLAGIYDGRGLGATPTIVIQSGTFKYFTNGGFQITSSSISTSTWYHLAVSRSGTSTKLFVNGVQGGSTYTDSTNYVSTTPSFVGALYNGSSLNGYIDDMRITKGYARYTATFTPPTAAFSNIGPT